MTFDSPPSMPAHLSGQAYRRLLGAKQGIRLAMMLDREKQGLSMIALLGLGVIGVQLVILASMLGAALLGKFWLKAACFTWITFTLFGSIFTMGLLLLQLVTIVIGYLLGKAICDRRNQRSA